MKLNKRQLADCLDVTEETITQWMREGCPVDSRARGSKGNVYDTGDVFAWRIAKAEKRQDSDERTRLLRLQADKVDLELAELRGEHVRFSDVTEGWAQHIAAARAKLLSLPSKIAPRVSPPDLVAATQELLRGIVDEALNELAGDGLPERARARRARAQGVESPPKADSKPVGGPRKGAKSGVKRRAGKVGDSKS